MTRPETRRGGAGEDAPRIRIGVSGWRYAPWRGVFYPHDLPQRWELRYLASIFPTVEINGSFYSLQRPESWELWHRETPPGFVFSVKGPRFITHMLKLREVEQPLANFLASGILALHEKLGPILWQFAPHLRFDPERFEAFLEMLPHDTGAALALARRRHPRMFGRSRLSIDRPRPLRHAMEIRHESFLDERFITLLRKHRVALVIAQTARKHPMPRDVTADFVYLRLHGDRQIYRSGYGKAALGRWAERIAAWHRGEEPAVLPAGAVRAAPPAPPRPEGRDVYCYFDNTDVKLRAPADARNLMLRLGLAPGRWQGEEERTHPSMGSSRL
ncbi:MAG TPA: DUF72 domain-containing protein [Candidatus Polarisedimenticolia bacterium]|nr:DUF72 domain-containing protein [Candidatus Polarisedimenticolia bacterium]